MYGSADVNLYPQNIASIVAASGTGTLCLNRYAKFVEGNGFVDVAFSEMVVNRAGETADTILHSLAQDAIWRLLRWSPESAIRPSCLPLGALVYKRATAGSTIGSRTTGGPDRDRLKN